MGSDARASAPRPAAWPALLTLLALSLLVVGFLQYRDPSLLPRAVSAARALPDQQLHLHWDPQLLPGPPASELVPMARPLTEPKTIHRARAAPELEREGSSVDASEGHHEALTPAEVQQRVANYEAWLRARGLTRLNGQ